MLAPIGAANPHAPMPPIRQLAAVWCALAADALESLAREHQADAAAIRLYPPRPAVETAQGGYADQVEAIRSSFGLPGLEETTDRLMGQAEAMAAAILAQPAGDVADAAIKALLLADLLRAELEPHQAAGLARLARDLARLAHRRPARCAAA